MTFPKGNRGDRHRAAQNRDRYVSWFVQIHRRVIFVAGTVPQRIKK